MSDVRYPALATCGRVAIWEYQATHGSVLPNGPETAPELEAIANKLIADADVNKQVLPSISKELVEYVCCALTAIA